MNPTRLVPTSVNKTKTIDTLKTKNDTATVVIAGNPNCGKTSIFNALTGSRHHVANWSGVTVEKQYGYFLSANTKIQVVDLPGTYSLLVQSEDERIAVQFLSESPSDVIVNVIDASNLERNLYLTAQLLELQKPMIVVLNMVDDLQRQGKVINLADLETLLNCPIVLTVGNRSQGIAELKQVMLNKIHDLESKASSVQIHLGTDIENELTKIEQAIQKDHLLAVQYNSRWLAIGLLEQMPNAEMIIKDSCHYQAIDNQHKASVYILEKQLDLDIATTIAEHRYKFANTIAKKTIKYAKNNNANNQLATKLDTLLTHKWLGIPIFFAIIMIMYGLTFIIGQYPQSWITSAFKLMQHIAAKHMPLGTLSSLLIDGIIPGVGAVMSFLPVIMILMGCTAFLEDTGYMSRAAFIMDRPMHLMGLHGKSFMPLIMGTGCNVPAVQATRTIESKSDRFITILISPLISCSARLQVYMLIAGAFFQPLQAALVIALLHMIGLVLTVGMGKLLSVTLFKRSVEPFIMELPPYRMPIIKTIVVHMWEQGKSFVTKAGTTILAGVILVWFLSHYPGIMNKTWTAERQRQEQIIHDQNLKSIESQKALSDLKLKYENRIISSSLAAKFGRTIQPVLAPVFDPNHKRLDAWKDGVALVAGFVGKEIVISTMGVIYQADAIKEPGNDHLNPLQKSLRQHSGFTPLTAFVFMVFIMLYTPCLGVISVIKQETNSMGWASFSVLYGIVLAWSTSWLIILLGNKFGFI